MSALNVLNALVMATQERTREIGIFAAIGEQRAHHDVDRDRGNLMCVIGCVLGVLLSFLAAFAFPRIPAIGNLILSFKPSIALIAPVLAAAFALCILGSLLPAWRAVRMVPAEALRRM
jgi:putative ABC transport system permease protein